MKSIIQIATMLFTGLLLLTATQMPAQTKTPGQTAAEEAAKAAEMAAAEVAKPLTQRDCAKIAEAVKKAQAAAKKAREEANKAQEAADKNPKSQAKKDAAETENGFADAAEASLKEALDAAPGMKAAEDIKKKVDGTSDSDNSKVKEIKEKVKKAADAAAAKNPCDPDAVKREVERELEKIRKEVEKNKEVLDWFDKNFPKKDGKRLNISFDSGSMDHLIATATGTGNTTGHVATLTLTNPTGLPITATFDDAYIPSSGEYQPYIVPSMDPITVVPGQTISLPLHGYCADVFSKPVPFGEVLPPFSNWVSTALTGQSALVPDLSMGWIPVTPVGTGLVPTIPGTSQPIGYTIDPQRYPAEAAPFLASALEAIANAYDQMVKSGQITTPFSGNPAKEQEAVIQQTLWIYAAGLSGKEYSKEDFRANIIRQYETATGRIFAKQDEKTHQAVEQGVTDFWNAFEAVGVEAKVLSNVQDNTDTPLKEANYEQYKHYRDMGQNHDKAMEHAVGIPDKRKSWSGEFKERYERNNKGK
jgi:hypothetical protein